MAELFVFPKGYFNPVSVDAVYFSRSEMEVYRFYLFLHLHKSIGL